MRRSPSKRSSSGPNVRCRTTLCRPGVRRWSSPPRPTRCGARTPGILALWSAGMVSPSLYLSTTSPTVKSSRRELRKAGGFVEATNGFFRVNGNLNLSRSIGDLKYKQSTNLKPEEQIITAEPDVLQHKLDPKDEFFIVACDGVWDVLSNQEAVDFVRTRIQAERGAGREPQLHGRAREAPCRPVSPPQPRARPPLRGGGDNMTCVVVEVVGR